MAVRGLFTSLHLHCRTERGTIFKKSVTHKEERQPCLGQQGLPIFMVSDRAVGKGDWEGESSLVKKERNSGENVPEATAVRSTCIQCC